MASYELYGASGCPYTRDMREWLELRRATFVEFDVEADAQARERFRSVAGSQHTVPVLVEDGRVVAIGWQGRGCAVGE